MFLLLLWLSKEKRKYIYFFGSSILYLSILLLSYIASPSLFKDFVRNAGGIDERGLINPSTLPLIRDLLSLLAERTGITVSAGVEWALFITVITAIVFVTWRAYRALRSAEVEDQERIAVFLACLVYALILPRFKDYSFVLLIVPTYFIIKRSTYLSAYPLLFIFAILSSRSIRSPALDAIFITLWAYYPLILAYCVWGLYLYEILVVINKARVQPAPCRT